MRSLNLRLRAEDEWERNAGSLSDKQASSERVDDEDAIYEALGL